MNWYKTAQGYAYHTTDDLRGMRAGLNAGSFFASSEDDISAYGGQYYIRFPFPAKFEKRIGQGDYHTTVEIIPANQIEWKEAGGWDRYQPL
jgi:hypothetical protein|tara:strand:- start:2159 stop:2431 length:273 start_codon:yes stop_codon:yes gene_type:complete